MTLLWVLQPNVPRTLAAREHDGARYYDSYMANHHQRGYDLTPPHAPCAPTSHQIAAMYDGIRFDHWHVAMYSASRANQESPRYGPEGDEQKL